MAAAGWVSAPAQEARRARTEDEGLAAALGLAARSPVGLPVEVHTRLGHPGRRIGVGVSDTRRGLVHHLLLLFGEHPSAVGHGYLHGVM